MTSPRDSERYSPANSPVLSPALSQTSRGQGGKRERLGTRLGVKYRTGNLSSRREGIAKGDGNEEGKRGKKILQLTPNNSNAR